MDVLIVLEQSNGAIHRISLEAVAAAQAFSSDLGLTTALLAIVTDKETSADEMSTIDVDEILIAGHALAKNYSSDVYAEALMQVIEREKPSYVFMGHSYQVRDYIPKVSARMEIPFLSDLIAYRTEDGVPFFIRQVFNGRLTAEVKPASGLPCLISFQSAAYSSDSIRYGSPPQRRVSLDLDASMIKAQAEEPFQDHPKGVDLCSADLIIGIGRGMGNEENIAAARKLADVLGAEIGCSRPVVDSGLLPPSHQIGSSGQTVSPKLYLALGISGATQHVVGMKGSKNIIAINKDPEAPIFDLADYGVVADLNKIVPRLTEALK